LSKKHDPIDSTHQLILESFDDDANKASQEGSNDDANKGEEP
jgi:hypothetical protein